MNTHHPLTIAGHDRMAESGQCPQCLSFATDMRETFDGLIEFDCHACGYQTDLRDFRPMCEPEPTDYRILYDVAQFCGWISQNSPCDNKAVIDRFLPGIQQDCLDLRDLP